MSNREHDDDTAYCPDCGAEVYLYADRCPKCGNYIMPTVRRESSQRGRAALLAAIAIITLIAFLLMLFR